ncbi:oligosaccharide flippase family protein [Mycobacterium sp. OTB74]|uniref:lipopolysaccharide biosynthesis protein n=1 Tax=Mycobacterium sp. OTB74 TaxID=1853452 RepID=UPI0024762C07|nr:oligosaccharide flippase family protein [Mycobacterium sp. OTB74]MDH6242397.1 O-antigen/teichoic acid export membrane protein [Mycobacterium sp. OTB74]
MSDRLNARERRSVAMGPVYRILGTPLVAILGLANTAIIVRETGAAVFGLVSLVATLTLLFPFADLGISSTILSASSQLHGDNRNPRAPDIIRRGYHVLFGVAGALIAISLCVMALDKWTVLTGFSSGPDDRWAITVAACLFALSIPAGVGLRILGGINEVPLGTVVMMSCPGFALAITVVLYLIQVPGIWYVVSALGGLLIGQIIGTVLALRLSGLGWSAFSLLQQSYRGERLLRGSLWLFLVAVGAPVGLQTGRLLLAHLSTPVELAQYALMAQLYGVCWSALSTAGYAFWPIFVQRRKATETTVRMWWQLTALFAGVAAIAMAGFGLLGPLTARLLSGGRIDVSLWLALSFGVLLIGQSAHLPASVLLTNPDEARWQAWWTMAMAAVSIALALAAAGPFGAVGVVLAGAIATLVAQVVPDLLWVPRLVHRRPVDAV